MIKEVAFIAEEISLPEYRALLNTMNGKPFSFRGIFDDSKQYEYGDLCMISAEDKNIYVYIGTENVWKCLPSGQPLEWKR